MNNILTDVDLPILLILAAFAIAVLSAFVEIVCRLHGKDKSLQERYADWANDWADEGYEDYAARDFMPEDYMPEDGPDHTPCPDCKGTGVFERPAMRVDGISYPAITGTRCDTCDGDGKVN